MEDGVSLIYGMKFKKETCLLTQSGKNCLSTNHRRKQPGGKNWSRYWTAQRAVCHCSTKNTTNTAGTHTVGVSVLPCGRQLHLRTVKSPENMLSLARGNQQRRGMPRGSWQHSTALVSMPTKHLGRLRPCSWAQMWWFLADLLVLSRSSGALKKEVAMVVSSCDGAQEHTMPDKMHPCSAKQLEVFPGSSEKVNLPD